MEQKLREQMQESEEDSEWLRREEENLVSLKVLRVKVIRINGTAK